MKKSILAFFALVMLLLGSTVMPAEARGWGRALGFGLGGLGVGLGLGALGAGAYVGGYPYGYRYRDRDWDDYYGRAYPYGGLNLYTSPSPYYGYRSYYWY